MGNKVSNLLTAYGSKQEIQRFVDTFTEEFAWEHLRVSDFIPEEHQDTKCQYWYRTSWNPRLYNLIQILGMFPKLFFRLGYGDYMSNFKGRMVSKGDRVLSLKEGAMYSEEELKQMFGPFDQDVSQESQSSPVKPAHMYEPGDDDLPF